MQLEMLEKLFFVDEEQVDRMKKNADRAKMSIQDSFSKNTMTVEEQIAQRNQTVSDKRRKVETDEMSAVKVSNEIVAILPKLNQSSEKEMNLFQEITKQFDIFKSLKNRTFLTDADKEQLEIVKNCLFSLKAEAKLVLLEKQADN